VKLALGLLTALALMGCVYFNTFYNARKYYSEGDKLAAQAPENAGLPAPARTAFERSIEKSSQVLTSHPNSKYADDALLLLGKAHYRIGDYAEAAAALRSLIESHPESGLRREAAIWLVRAGRASGESETAEQLASELLTEGNLSTSDRLALQLERAKLALEGGDAAGAIAIYEDLEQADADAARDEGVPLLLAEAHVASGDTASALEELRPLVSAETDAEIQRQASVLLAGILASSGDRERAIETYQEVLAGGVGDSLAAEIHLALAATRHGAGDFPGAAEELGAAARIVPSTALAATALYHRGLVEWHDLRSRDEAKKTLLEAFLQDPSSPAADSAAVAARTIQEIQHYQAILDGSEKVLSPLPPAEVKATATYLLAELLYTREDDAEGAHKLFSDMLTLYPGSAWTPKVLYTLGWLAEQDGHAGADSADGGPRTLPPEAAELYDRLIAEYPRTEYAQYAREALADAAGAASVAPAEVAVPEVASGGTGEPQASATAAPDLLPLPAQGDVVEVASDSTATAAPSPAPLDSAATAGSPAPLDSAAAAGSLAALDSAPETDSLVALDSAPSLAPDEPDVPEIATVAPESAQVVVEGEGGADRASVSLASAPAIDAPGTQVATESVDEQLMAYTLALPRAQDPLIGIEDRLLARKREEIGDRAPGARITKREAEPDLGAPGRPPAAADSLTAGQIDSLVGAGGFPGGDQLGAPRDSGDGGGPGDGDMK
jgi:TolA-binding protein